MAEKSDLYIKLDEHVRTEKKDVPLSKVAGVYCQDEELKSQAEKVIVYSFQEGEKEKAVFSLIYIYKKIYECMGSNIQIHSVGASECLVDWIQEKRPSKLLGYVQVVLVGLVTFFGAAFTIMTYNADAGVPDVFRTRYEIFTGRSGGNGVLELTYSIGIGIGVIVFFHHFEKKGRKTPTAMEVQMNKYEKDVVDSYVKYEERRGNTFE
ncbi:MAG: stage V sporulation protein AA [Frisingicoccus sp.]|uniref:stage V sporulation protein AA n=1 Tax=Frisingicoccus sp. TaxID=1918627 RepID=UPI002614A8C7|nr:stage V sporulation protein AA [Frisingicoccus sp.]MDD6232503.1 stage V sporulation protein AA [Frisingicoccus sp.]